MIHTDKGFGVANKAEIDIFLEFPCLLDVQAAFRKGKGTRDQTDTSAGSLQKQERSRKSSTSTLLTMPKPLSVWITTNWKILQVMGISDHLISLLRNLYLGKEAS